MYKRWLTLMLAGLMTIRLCGCAERAVKDPKETPSPEPPQTPTPTPVVETAKTSIEAYREALERLVKEHIDLDGSQISGDGWDFIQEVAFALQDVDLDGAQELLVRYYRTTQVCGYDAERGELVEKLRGTESCRFYDNGLVQIDSSHNQGRGGRFWPYCVSSYNKQTGKYDDIAWLDAWDFELVPAPEYQQAVGAGDDEFIYYYTVPGTGEAREETTMTQAKYDAWYQDTFGGAEEIEVSYQPLTISNIGNLFCEGVKPKAVVNVESQWINYDMWDHNAGGFGLGRLSKRQNQLLEDLPVDQLPREAAKTWEREEIWEDTLLPMCYDKVNDFTLYAVVTEESVRNRQKNGGGYLAGSGILARRGDTTRYFYIEHDQFWAGGNPAMVVKDLNGDGEDEIAVSLLAAHGSGVGIEALYIFDVAERWFEDHTVDFSTVDIDVAYDEKTNLATLTSGGERVSVEVTCLSEGQSFDGVYVGDQVHYRYEDGKLLCELALDFSGRGAGYLAKATGEVVYQYGRYTLGPLKLELERN